MVKNIIFSKNVVLERPKILCKRNIFKSAIVFWNNEYLTLNGLHPTTPVCSACLRLKLKETNFNILKTTLLQHFLSPSWETMYAQQFRFNVVSLKISVNQPISIHNATLFIRHIFQNSVFNRVTIFCESRLYFII